MTKELLLNELNRNNEFNEITPKHLEEILGKTCFIVNGIIVDSKVYFGEELGCSYLTLGKSYEIDLSEAADGSELGTVGIFIEGATMLDITDMCHLDRSTFKLTVTLPNTPSEEGPDSGYIDLMIGTFNPK